MSSSEDIDDFASIFQPLVAHRASRNARAARERKTQQTEKQRKRQAVRTTQMNFRCSPAFKARSALMAKNLDCSIADLMERALDALAQEKGIKGAGNA